MEDNKNTNTNLETNPAPNNATPTPNPVADNYLEQIKTLKANSVAKEEYDKVVAQNKQLLESFVNGDYKGEKKPKEPANIEELTKKFFDGKQKSNLEFVKQAVALRDAVLEQKGTDLFLPTDKAVSSEEVKMAQNTADIYHHCIDYAGNDPEAFTNELMRLTKDTGPAPATMVNNRFTH